MNFRSLLLTSATLSFALAASPASADVAPPPCQNLMAGAACVTPAGEAGLCVPDANGNLECVAGSGGAGGGGTTTTTTTTTTTGSGGSSGGGDEEDDSGCSFAAPTPVTGAGLGLVLGLGALLIGRRRRRR